MRKLLFLFIGFVLVFSGCKKVVDAPSYAEFTPPAFVHGTWTGTWTVAGITQNISYTFTANDIVYNGQSLSTLYAGATVSNVKDESPTYAFDVAADGAVLKYTFTLASDVLQFSLTGAGGPFNLTKSS